MSDYTFTYTSDTGGKLAQARDHADGQPNLLVVVADDRGFSGFR